MRRFNFALFLVTTFFAISCGKGLHLEKSSALGSSGSFKKISLVSAAFPTGDGGLGDFDSKCSSGYRALVGSVIERSPTLDWVLKANTEYRRTDGTTVIGTTNGSAVFTFPLKNSFGAAAGKYYTGLQADWSINTLQNCDNWLTMADDRSYGDALSTSSTAIAESIHNCGTSGPVTYVVCVEQ